MAPLWYQSFMQFLFSCVAMLLLLTACSEIAGTHSEGRVAETGSHAELAQRNNVASHASVIGKKGPARADHGC